MNRGKKPRFIGIAGPSCAGKTALAHRLAKHLPQHAAVISLDAYYRDLAHLPQAERAQANFDTPEAIDHHNLIHHIEALARGETIRAPRYNFQTHTRQNSADEITPRPFIIIEGLFALYWEKIRRLLELKVFIDLDENTCLQRRIKRDIKQRGREKNAIIAQYQNSVRPMYKKHAEPTRKHAGIILNGQATLEQAISHILRNGFKNKSSEYRL